MLEEPIAEVSLGALEGLPEEALLVKRFDYTEKGRIHFEEFNQRLGKPSEEKYNGSYKDMSHFILHTKEGIPSENYRLYARMRVGLLLGNTDMHLKNFFMFHT